MAVPGHVTRLTLDLPKYVEFSLKVSIFKTCIFTLSNSFLQKSRVNDFIADGPKNTIRLIMKYLIQDNVQEKYCWNGTAEKLPFKNLKSINKFMYSVVRENFPKFKKSQYESYMGQWLKQARSRQRIVTYKYPNRKDGTDDDDDQDEDNDDDSDEQNW